MQPHWGAEASNGTLLVELQLPPGVRAGERVELCIGTVVDEDCVGRHGVRREDLWDHKIVCFDAREGKRVIAATLQAACWYVVAVAKRDGAELGADLSWARVVSSDASSDRFLAQAGVSEGEGGRLALFERAVNEAAPDGLVLEFGGGAFSTATLARLLESRRQAAALPLLHTFDWWKGLPRAWRSGFGTGSFSNNGRAPQNVQHLADRGTVALVDGLVESTLEGFVKARSNDSTTLGLAVMDLCLGEATRAALHHLVPWLRPGSLILFGSFANYAGWENGGEHAAWTEEASKAGVSFEYVAFYSSWMLVRVTKAGEAPVRWSAVRIVGAVFAAACVAVGLCLLWLLQQRPRKEHTEARKKRRKCKVRGAETDAKVCKLVAKLDAFRAQCAAIGTDAGTNVRKDLAGAGTKMQAAIIATLDESGINRKPLLEMQDELSALLVALIQPKPAVVPQAPQEEAEGVLDALLCVVCLEKAKCVLLLPCSHVCVCETCALAVHACPLCREAVVKTHKVFV